MILAAVTTQTQSNLNLLVQGVGWVDVIFLLSFVFGMVFGLKQGLGRIIPQLFAIIVAQVVAVEYHGPFADLLYVGLRISFEFLDALVFALLAISSMVLVRLLFQLLTLMASVEFKSPVNNIGATILGGFQWILFLGLTASFLTFFPIPLVHEAFTSNRSLSGPYFVESSQYVHDFL